MSMPTPSRLFATVNAYQQSAALKAAVKLGVFSAIAAGNATHDAIAKTCDASPRGIRTLCDYLTVVGLLTKTGDHYALPPDVALFLNRSSPAYMGDALGFLLAPNLVAHFDDLVPAVKAGRTTHGEAGSMAPEHPMWIEFARAMGSFMRMPAMMLGEAVGELPAGARVLDIAAGHGLFGLAVAQKNPTAQVVAVDWAPVLAVAQENARAAGAADRYRTLPGSAFDVELEGPYQVVLLCNFLHHFEPPTCETLLRKLHAALVPGGRVVTLEFVPNPDRVSPPEAAAFSLTMLATTPGGDAYTFEELSRMFANAGFSASEHRPLGPMPQSLVVSTK